MKNIKFSRPIAWALIAGVLDIVEILGTFYFLSLTGFKGGTGPLWLAKVCEIFFVIFCFPGMIFNPLLWALFGFVLEKP